MDSDNHAAEGAPSHRPAALSASEHDALRALVDAPDTPSRHVVRGRIVLAAAEGLGNQEIARRTGTSLPTVALWRRRYAEDGVAGLKDRPRSGRPSVMLAEAGGREDPLSPPGTRGATTGKPVTAIASAQPEGTVDPGLAHLLDAAARTISRRGFAATRVSDIAAEAGVSPATVHYHFKIREEILVRALHWAHDRPLQQLEQAIRSIDDPVVRLAMLIERTMPYAGLQRDEYLLEIDLWSQVRSHPELLPVWERYEQRWIDHVTEMIDAGISSGDFTTTVDAGELAERLVALTDGLCAQTAIESSRMPPQRVRRIVLAFAAEQLGVPVERLDRAALVPGLSTP